MSSSTRTMRLAAPEPPKTVKPLAERGRMLFVRDVLELLPKNPDGSPIRSTWWVRNSFCPTKKHKLGRDPFWWECDVTEWLESA